MTIPGLRPSRSAALVWVDPPPAVELNVILQTWVVDRSPDDEGGSSPPEFGSGRNTSS